jgi:hypothetical protein
VTGNDFILEARFTSLEVDGSPSDATVVSSVVAKQTAPESDVVELRLNTAGDDVG